MTTPTVVHNTFVLERHYPQAPERVYAAFADMKSKRRWFVDVEGFETDHYEMDFRVGGFEHSRFRHTGGPPMTFEGVYQDIVPNRRIVFAYSMTMAGARMSSSLNTVEFRPSAGGTDLVLTEQGAFFDDFSGTEHISGREEGTRGMLELLAAELDAH